MLWILILLFCLTIVLSTLTTIPLIIAMILFLTVSSRNPWVFLAALLGGLVVDLLNLRTFGLTSLFLVVFTFMIFLYQRKFEIRTVAFVFIGSFIGSLVYLMVFGYNQVLMQALVNAAICVLLFKLLIRRIKMSSLRA